MILLYGLSGAGKTTIGKEFIRQSDDLHCKLFDGDELRETLCKDLGLSEEDRKENNRRICNAAVEAENDGILAIVTVMCPTEEMRDIYRDITESKDIPMIEIFVNVSVDVCEERDVKNLYKRYSEGGISGMYGKDLTFETPKVPYLELTSSDLEENIETLKYDLDLRGLVDEYLI